MTTNIGRDLTNSAAPPIAKTCTLETMFGGDSTQREAERRLKEITNAMNAVTACEGAELHDELQAVGRTFSVFDGNRQQLASLLAKTSDPGTALTIWDSDHPERFDAFLAETDRLLHNYVAAAGSLADHTQRLWQKYPPADAQISAEYSRRANEAFADNGAANVIRGVRNLALHRRLPDTAGRMTFDRTQGEPAFSVITGLQVQALLSSNSDWNRAATRYLKQAGEIIDIGDLIRDYSRTVEGFNAWYAAAWVSGHQAEFDELNRLMSIYNALLPDFTAVAPPGRPQETA